MSRIGNNPVAIPEGVTVDISNGVVTVKGKLGELTQNFDSVAIKVEDGNILVTRSSDTKDQKGTYKVKIEKGDKLKYIQDQQSIEIELIT